VGYRGGDVRIVPMTRMFVQARRGGENSARIFWRMERGLHGVGGEKKFSDYYGQPVSETRLGAV